ncbi:hypothetical protein CA600_05280 [Paenibacillus sp. VTT E-133280]|uniref:hypothetical protein n=1 Tax=Paenibacillus TaxID=44249 RepID=UPI00061F0AF5|nr:MULTISPECIES: hypothetical protein [Paenibacillus]KKC47799.1 hypothetical protein VE23_12870 [Paenibacillus sp. D9]MEC0259861.1 hypothetical protein [Paenibacillus lautus]OZQ68835.1 hypothetical protein CA600_05280 [Paenibacillus sp. VTT E-133280]
MNEGVRTLICEILILTYLDISPRPKKGGKNFQNRQEALAFLNTAWFEVLCAGIELEPEIVRRKMLQISNSSRLKRKGQ